jgi:hypothetical protein
VTNLKDPEDEAFEALGTKSQEPESALAMVHPGCAVVPRPMAANEVQHGGTHYKVLPIQPWDYVVANGIGFLEGNAIKYLTRWRDKGGVQDLQKARHYIDKLIEVETQKGTP